MKKDIFFAITIVLMVCSCNLEKLAFQQPQSQNLNISHIQPYMVEGAELSAERPAPHLLSEKTATYFKAPSGLPTIQQSLPALLTIAVNNNIPLTQITKAFSEKAAEIYGLKRGKIENGYAADLVIFDLNKEFTVHAEDLYSKCGWSPYEGENLKGYIETVFVNGEIALKDGKITEEKAGKLLQFN